MTAAVSEKIYNEFRARALSDFQFELAPLEYSDFLDAVQRGIIQCLVFEDAFLIYTTAISESIELNVVYAYDAEHFNALIKMFLDATQVERKTRIVCYPMLGVQKEFVGDLCEFGFKFTGSAVLRFTPGNKSMPPAALPSDYTIVPWDNSYLDAAVKIINDAFKDSPDALFDTRFKTIGGTRDILDKIVQNIYAEFLPQATSVLLHSGEPVGVCFINLTGSAANIPLIAITKEHQGKGLSANLLQYSMNAALILPLSELNVTTATDTTAALRMYRRAGFKEDYVYPQAYLGNFL